MVAFPVRIYDKIFSEEGDIIVKNLFGKEKRKISSKNNGFFSPKMVTAGVSRKVFSGKRKIERE